MSVHVSGHPAGDADRGNEWWPLVTQVVVERLLERQRAENAGKYPETIAVVLWGTDNIKTYGESLAQVC